MLNRGPLKHLFENLQFKWTLITNMKLFSDKNLYHIIENQFDYY